MDSKYAKQAELVIQVMPHVSIEDCFALKGGTAINLFELDLPRISVDIDLTYTIITDWETTIREINAALERIAGRLTRVGIAAHLSGTNVSRKILCTTADAAIKIEPNFILRGTTLPTRRLSASPKTQALFGNAKMQVLSQPELFGGKFCAALDRQHPRDLFDVAQFYMTHTITEEFKRGFLTLALGHNRPLHELLNPILQDHREIFVQQFAGMSDTPFTYEEHEATFAHLRNDLLAALTSDDKQHLLDFVSLEGNPDDFGIDNLSRLPAIVWKQKNLDSLRRSNPEKFAEQRTLLEKLLIG